MHLQSSNRLMVLLSVMMFVTQCAHSQTLTVLHSFGGPDGEYPVAALTLDQAGNLYGTTFLGGSRNLGTVFRLMHRSSGWVFGSLYSFQGPDGANPASPLIFGRGGALYGTASYGGQTGNGVIFALRPPSTICRTSLCPWHETLLYSFTGGIDSEEPQGQLAFDSAGNLYGVAYGYYIAGMNPPPSDAGSVWELARSNNGWAFSVLHSFHGGDGANPIGGVTFDPAGNLNGTTTLGGAQNDGTVFQLKLNGSAWQESVLHSFDSEVGIRPSVIADAAGNLYGATDFTGDVYELTPSGTGWSFANIFHFLGSVANNLAIDSHGNLYGASNSGGFNNAGFIFKLSFVQGSWTFTNLYNFTGGNDGGSPWGGVIVDAQGNIYGTCQGGGANGGQGTVWVLQQ